MDGCRHFWERTKQNNNIPSRVKLGTLRCVSFHCFPVFCRLRPSSLWSYHRIYLGHVKLSWCLLVYKSVFKWGRHGIWLTLFCHSLIFLPGKWRIYEEFPSLVIFDNLCVFQRPCLSRGVRVREMDSSLLWNMLVLGSVNGLRQWPPSHWHRSLWHCLGFTHLVVLLFLSLHISFHWFHWSLVSWCSGTRTQLGSRTSGALGWDT